MVHPWMEGSVMISNNRVVSNSSSFVSNAVLQSDKSIYEFVKQGEITVNTFGRY